MKVFMCTTPEKQARERRGLGAGHAGQGRWWRRPQAAQPETVSQSTNQN